MIIKEISCTSPQYEAAKRFRNAILRIPLGLILDATDLAGEDLQAHIVAMDDDGAIIGTVLLKPLSGDRVRLRQMAVLPSRQHQGIGRRLVQFAEEAARAGGFGCIELHARLHVQGFYERLGYQAQGATFIEVTLPTVEMIKRLSD